MMPRFTHVPFALLALAIGCDPPAGGPVPPRDVPDDLGAAPPGVVGVTPSAAVCGADLAATTFRFGLCTCEDLAFSTVLRVEAFRADPSQPVEGGSAGTNGSFTSTGDSSIAGTLAVGGSALPIGNHEIGGELYTQGDVTSAGDIDIGADAWVGGDLRGFVTDVVGTLHVPAASTVGLGTTAASVVNTPVTVEPPCPCDPGDRLDVNAFIADAEQHNDDAAIGLTRDALIGLLQPKELTLPPGRYYVDRISAVAPLWLTVTGPTALYVGGDVESVSVFEIHIEGAGELDLFVGGSLLASGDFEMGVEGGPPSKVRTYIAGAEDIVLAGDLDFQGNLWAPNARLIAAGPLDVEGALLVREIVEAGVIHVGWDESVQDGAGSCDETGMPVDGGDDGGNSGDPGGDPGGDQSGDDPPPAAGCDSCEDCGNQACNDGVCGACASSLDCCAPLVCAGGTCVPLSG
ncbi:MAG: hypothetical protein A2138_11265 [Deltaproteobacteria bacterium RBG_16_71_12]|nr:MAG: hypothetical protein A2138_11265 [Deltaproteobacteria bacterium RBG_16_71_12]